MFFLGVFSLASSFLNASVLNGSLLAAEPADSQSRADDLFRPGEHICLVGNALAERLQHSNEFEALLHQAFADKQLVIRNLAFPGDEVYERIRSENFGDPDEHLRHSQATMVLYFFGFNESFDGVDAADRFRLQLEKLVRETRETTYGAMPTRVGLVSPIAMEDTGDPHLPPARQANARLEAFTAAMKAAAESSDALFIDLFHPSLEWFEKQDTRMTLNGCHLSDEGYEQFAPVFFQALVGQAAPKIDTKVVAAVDDKNFHWWHRYRAVNGYSIYGTRGRAGSDGTYNNRDVMERERAILDQMTANRDARIWQLAAGENVSGPIDDSKTLPFFDVKTNVGGPDDRQAKAGKLGSLDYLPAFEQQKMFDVHKDFEIQLVASEEQFPELANPVALCFDNDGRLFVATMPSYPHWKPKTKLDDKILLLEDDDNDGTTDRCVVFADGLHQPTGFEIGHGGMYIAEQPDILFVRDTDGDGVADQRTRKLFGFDTADSHHGIAAFEWSPGGRLHFQEGTFKFSQVETPYGLRRLGEGGVWSYHPKTESVDVFVNFAFANPWGHVFDDWGQSFIADASPGFSYWASPISGRIDYPLKHPGGSQHRRVAKIGGGDSQFRLPTFYPKRTRPSAGATMVSGDHFPPEMRGNFLLTNVIGDRSVLNHQVREDGSGFSGTEVDALVSGRDGNFRPVDVEFHPDGSLYIVDWHNALIGHLQHNLRDPSRDKSHGRIWRIRHKTRPLVPVRKLTRLPVDDLVALLGETDTRLVYRVRRELASRPTDDVMRAAQVWEQTFADDDPRRSHHELELLWLCQAHHVVDLERLESLLRHRDHRVRCGALQVMTDWMDSIADPLALLAPRIQDDHPRVRLEAVRALSFTQSSDSQSLALRVLERDTDPMILYTLEETLRRLEQVAAQ